MELDLIVSIILGFVLFLSIIYLFSGSKPIFEGSMVEKNESNTDTSVVTDEVEQRLQKCRKLQKVLGASDDEIRNSLVSNIKHDESFKKAKKLQKVLGADEQEIRASLDESAKIEKIIKKTKKLQKVLGVSETEVRDAIKTKLDDQRNGIPDLTEQRSSIIKIVEWGLFVGMIGAGLFALNSVSEGNFARIMVGIFPVEFEALGLKEYFERVPSFSSIPATASH